VDNLALVNRARNECGVSGSDLVTLQTGLSMEGQRFVQWVNQAWIDIQASRPDWQWMRKAATFQTVAAQAAYTIAEMGVSDLGDWKRNTFRSYLTSTGVGAEQFMNDWEYSAFRDTYQFSSLRSSTGYPLDMTIQPDKTMALWPTPNAAYTINGEYYRAPTELSADDDDPSSAGNGLPDRFHMLIVGYAMESYAAYESAPEVDERAKTIIRRHLTRLINWGLPPMFGAPALA